MSEAFTVVDLVDEEITVVEITDEDVTIVETIEAETTVVESGARGDRGPRGVPGPPGDTYAHTQDVPAAVWEITHDLGYQPAVTVVDSSNREVIGDVEYLDVDHLRVTFSAAFGGQAFLS